MKKFNMRISSWLILALFFWMSCKQAPPEKQSRVDTLPYYQDASFTPHWISPDDPTLDTFHRISAFQLFNQDGDTITEMSFSDKIYVTDFFFTFCPGICPKMTANFAILQDAFMEDKEVLLLSHTVTPERDSVPILKTYAEDKGVISGKWHLVTGTQQTIYELGRKAYFVEEDLGVNKDIDEFLHTENFVLIDKNRHIRGIYNGLNKTALNQLIADIKTLKKEG